MGYNVPVSQSWVKAKMASELAKSILSNNSIPVHQIMNNYQVVHESMAHVEIRKLVFKGNGNKNFTKVFD